MTFTFRGRTLGEGVTGLLGYAYAMVIVKIQHIRQCDRVPEEDPANGEEVSGCCILMEDSEEAAAGVRTATTVIVTSDVVTLSRREAAADLIPPQALFKLLLCTLTSFHLTR